MAKPAGRTSPRDRAAAKRAPSRRARDDLIERIGLQVRKVGAQSTLTGLAVAERFGLHTTDLEVLDLIHMKGEPSAGDVAAATGLTSGAVTALIDRLEERGYVERLADPGDRRRTLVRIRRHTVAPIEAVYRPMQAKMYEVWSRFSARELEVILRFLTESHEASVEATAEIRRGIPEARVKRRPPRAGHA